jgi:squalene-hopene/tetraprenyl-beta-curcumene cyclase
MGLLATETGFRNATDDLILEAREALKARQRADGHWIFEFEADATIPAEYILLQHFLGALEPRFTQEVQPKIANYLRDEQGGHDGWGLFHGGDFDMSATVKVYFALKLAGDDVDAPHMARAREAVLARGGAARCNVFTRIALALFGQVPWRAVPVMPVEITLLPRWFPFHLEKVSYWSRTVMVPLLILMALKPQARNPLGLGIRELFTAAPEEADYKMNATGTALGAAFAAMDKVLRSLEPGIPKMARNKAIRKALDFIEPRLNGEDGLGGIFPAMANAVMAYEALGTPRDDENFKMARAAVDKLLIFHGDRAYCQPCLSPIWDTCLGLHALLEAGEPHDSPAVQTAIDWMLEREITGTYGDWVRQIGRASCRERV